MRLPGFVGPTYTLQDRSADAQSSINLYFQPDESGAGKSPAQLLCTPGLKVVANYSAYGRGGDRGLYRASNKRVFMVVEAKLLEIASDYSVLGSYDLAGEAGQYSKVSMADNGLAMMIATGPQGFFFDFSTNTLTQITDEVFNGADTCRFLDGYFLFNEPGTQKFWITDLYSSTIQPLGFASAEGSPDALITLLVDHDEIWLFGDTSSEVWYNSGDANFTFAKIQGTFMTRGIVSKNAAVNIDNTVMWLGKDDDGNGIFWRANGYVPVRCSTFAVEQAIQRYPRIDDVTSFSYQQDGHTFAVFNFPAGDATWVYDAATNLWHERAYLGTLAVNDGNLHRGRPDTHTFAWGKHLVGDYETALLYEMSPLLADSGDRETPRIRRAPYLCQEQQRIRYHQFQLDCTVGIGNPGALGAGVEPEEPVATLRWSDDGANTWSNEKECGLGKSGQYRKRVIWRRLGQSRDRLFETKVSARGVIVSFHDAYLELGS